MKVQLLELAFSESLRVDKESGVIHDVKILGRDSRNGRKYSDSAMDQAAKLYEGCKVNVDHPDRSNPKRERGLLEGFGVIRNVKRDGDSVRGDLHFIKSHPAAPVICESAERFPDKFGLSHNAEGDTSPDGKLVESVTRVRSVDIVGRPATNDGLFESEDDPTHQKGEVVKKTTLRQLVESIPGSAVIRRQRAAKALLEMDGEGSAMPDMPVEVSDGGSSEDQIKAAFRAMVIAAFDDDSLDSKATLAKIKDILTAQEKLMTGSAPKADSGSSSGDGGGSGSPVSESIMEELREIRRERQEGKVVRLLESLNVEATAGRVKALMALPEGEREGVAKEFPKRQAAGRMGSQGYGVVGIQKPAVSAPLVESESDGDFDAGMKRLRERFAGSKK